MSKNKKQLVIDADTIKSASDRPHRPHGYSCAMLLSKVRAEGHSVAVCQKLGAEWKKHASQFSATWITSMRSRGQFIKKTIDTSEIIFAIADEFRDNISIQEILIKDSHLVILASHSSRIVISKDSKCRNHFVSLSGTAYTLISNVHWVSPLQSEINLWLASGCPERPEWQLKHYTPQT